LIAGESDTRRATGHFKPRGGIEFVEIGKSQGSPEIKTIVSIASLDEAARFYDKPHL